MSVGSGAAFAALCLLSVACSKPRSAPSAAPSASVSAITSAAPSSTVAERFLYGHVVVPRDSLVPPPLSPPADALAGPGGVHMQLLSPGSGDSPSPLDTIVLDFSMWTGDGRLAMSSYPEAEPAAFSISSLPQELRSMLTQLKVGAKARYWLPRASLAGWKPNDWPDADLIFEVELRHISRVTVSTVQGDAVDPQPFQPPDAAGPPKSAATTSTGVRYIYLAHAVNERHPAPDTRLDLVISAYVLAGIVPKLAQNGVKTATTLARAPAPLHELLSKLSSGDRVRVWLPKGQGQLVIGDAGKGETILDLAISFVTP